MGGHRMPEKAPLLRAQPVEQAMHDGARRFGPDPSLARRPVRTPPPKEIPLAGEGDARPAHPLVAGCLPNRHDLRVAALLEIGTQVGPSNGGGIGHIVWAA